MRWRGATLALAALLADLAASSCAGARQWTEDESSRIDAITSKEVGRDAGVRRGGAPPGVAMGPSPPLAEPTRPREQLTPATPWSQPPWRRGTRWYLGKRRRAQVQGQGTAAQSGEGAAATR